MPKSKRKRTTPRLSSSQVSKKLGLEPKQRRVSELRSALDNFEHCCIFVVLEGMRNHNLQQMRDHFKAKDSKLFMGKTRLAALAMGKDAREEHAPNLSRLSQILKDAASNGRQQHLGLLFSNAKKSEIQDYFESNAKKEKLDEFGRAGCVCVETVVLPADEPLPGIVFSMETQLKALGLPTRLVKGEVQLVKEHVVCKKGDTLRPEQARVLKMLGIKQARFRTSLLAMWSKSSGEVETFQNPDDEENNEEDDEEDME